MPPRKSRGPCPSKKQRKQRSTLQKPRISAQERVQKQLENTEKKALPAELQAVFHNYRRLFLKWADPYTRQGIPLEVLHEYCIMSSLTHWKTFDPNRGTSFASFIITGWKYALKNARWNFNQGTRIWKHLRRASEKEEGTLLQTISSKEPTPDEKMAIAQDIARLRLALNHLPEIEKMVIALRFGIDTEEKTLKEVGTILDITKQRVQQIQQSGMRKLRQFLTGK